MSSNENQQAYDRGVSVFSPEGRIYQVEYAREAVRNGSPSAGVQTDDGVVLASVSSNQSSLKVAGNEVRKIEESLGAVTTGYIPDGRRLVENLRVSTQRDQLRYDEEPKVETVAKQVADDIQETTQVGGRRPFGASLIIGGVDREGTSLYEVEPGGTPSEWHAVADGNGRREFIEYFEENYDESFSVDEATQMLANAFQEVAQSDVTAQTFEVATVASEDEQFTKLENDELEEYLE